jgi:hypothetical protein
VPFQSTLNMRLAELIADLDLDRQPLAATFHDNDSVISLESSTSEARPIYRWSSLSLNHPQREDVSRGVYFNFLSMSES